jgi:hypothetical protein
MILDDSASKEGVDSHISVIDHVHVNNININHHLKRAEDF